MKSRTLTLFITTLGAAALALALTGCNPPASPPSGSGEVPTDQAALVAQAQKEGSVRIGTGGHTEAQVTQLAEAFEAEYGIDVEFVRESSGQIVQKVEAQAASGNLAFDVVGLLDRETMQRWSEDGMLADVDLENSNSVLPAFETGVEPYYPVFWQVLGYTYNEDRTPNPPSTWEALSKAGTAIGLGNPATSGASLTFAAAMSETEPDFYTATAANNEVLVQDSALGLGQLVLTGEIDFAVPGSEQDVFAQTAAGEPIRMAYPDGPIATTVSYVAALEGVRNSAAAALLIQFMLSEEFQTEQLSTGSRPVLEGVPAPDGLEEIAEDRIVTVDTSTLEEIRGDVVSNFDEAVSQ